MYLFEDVQAEKQKSNEWYTPSRYIEAAREVMGSIDLDPASCEFANKTVKASKYYTKEDNGLAHSWYGNVWLNPPYGRIDLTKKGSTKSYQVLFAHKLIAEYHTGNVRQAICLFYGPSCSMRWFDTLWNYLLCFCNRRITFDTPQKDHDAHYGYGNIFVYLGVDEERFIDIFSQFGRIAKAVDTPKQPIIHPSLWEQTL